jgi:hypothetical protein
MSRRLGDKAEGEGFEGMGRRVICVCFFDCDFPSCDRTADLSPRNGEDLKHSHFFCRVSSTISARSARRASVRAVGPLPSRQEPNEKSVLSPSRTTQAPRAMQGGPHAEMDTPTQSWPVRVALKEPRNLWRPVQGLFRRMHGYEGSRGNAQSPCISEERIARRFLGASWA